MYIHPFFAGVIATLIAEAVGLVIAAVIKAKKGDHHE